ncbi:hypothetical protein [Lactobacillus amylovorus]|uniref:hypothetical protein n=1 Tax=Lactobacillus amylovorus TaxID=1604 RepID=UPI00232ADFCE|nr:hypothetical protein [Lactobacillus amylovorus]MDB6253065.1 hypothetical protein [Lactobacillus amylovorus]
MLTTSRNTYALASTTSPLLGKRGILSPPAFNQSHEVTSSLARAKQHFIEALYYRLNKLVTVDKDNIKTSIFGATMLSIVTDSKIIDEIVEMPIENLIDYFQTKGRGRFSDPEALAKAIKKAVRGSYRLGKATFYTLVILW